MQRTLQWTTQHMVGVLVAAVLGAVPAAAQDRTDVTERLRSHLPADVAERVLQHIEDARARGLPAVALERRALELVAKELPAVAVERGIAAQSRGLAVAAEALARAGVTAPTTDEIEAGATAMAKGVDGQGIADIARAAPSGQSLAVPLTVMASLIDRGLPADAALGRVRDRLTARASMSELARPDAGPMAVGRPSAPGAAGLGTAGAASAGARGQAGPPAAVPGPGGNNVPRPISPTTPERPSMPARAPEKAASSGSVGRPDR